ncbi:MAG: ATP-binding protein [Acidobacteria bacterium]|nr:ATP-binding protein [Acidobacteriota bacterium]
MAKLDILRTRDLLQKFDFKALFIEELGWAQPTERKSIKGSFDSIEFERRQIAQLSGVVIFEIISSDGVIPNAKARAAIHKQISQLHHENLFIFLNQKDNPSQSLWYWVKREGNKTFVRDHLYIKGQPGDLFLSKLSAMVVDLSEFDQDGNVPVIVVARRLKDALDVERVTKKFYKDYSEEYVAFTELIQGIDDERDRRWYASILLNRLMFIYFLQSKHFLNEGDIRYLQNKLAESKGRGRDLYYQEFLRMLFFEGFAKPDTQRTPEVRALLGNIKYLNGGLFLEHRIELNKEYDIRIPDLAFENLLALFGSYSWNLNDSPEGKDDEINPDVLGYIFEKYINQKAFGAYYTRIEITEYLCERTIDQLILKRINAPEIKGVLAARQFDSLAELLMNLNAPLCRELLFDVLPNLSLLDPACGSGAFLVAAMKRLIYVYSAITGRIKFLSDANLTKWLHDTERQHKSLHYFIKKRIITDNLFGVDVMEEATEIARLRLFLSLVASAQSVEQLEPLPNIDFNILTGNSLMGILKVNAEKFNKIGEGFQGSFFGQWDASDYNKILEEKNRSIALYKDHAFKPGEHQGLDQHTRLLQLREHIEKVREESYKKINTLLLDEFRNLGIKYEQATWDDKKNKEGKAEKRPLDISDMERLRPFHWGYEFDRIIVERGGFDAIITNPPWEIFKPQAKEFFAEYSDLVTKNKMTIKDFEKEQAKLLKQADVRAAWLEFLSRFPHVSLYYRNAQQYKNQIAIVNGKKAGTDINLYKLFTEQCFNLLREGGQGGIVIPSGIYTDLGTKQLREMLFNQTEVTGLFCFENRKEIFEGVHRSFKFIVLTFEKGKSTKEFPSAFMRLDVAELVRFPRDGALRMSVELIRRLSPDSLSVMEFKNELEIQIAEKMLRFPLLGDKLEDKWNLVLCNEFHMTNDSHLFKSAPGKGRLPLYEGKMIHQFTHKWGEPKYWLDEKEARRALLGTRGEDTEQKLDYQKYRMAFREIASNTNERAMISTLLPGNVFANHKLMLSSSRGSTSYHDLLFCCALLNGFSFDYQVRQRTTTTISMFTFYQLPLPRLTSKDAVFAPIVERAARLICTTPEYDDLARQVGLASHQDGATNETERARLRAELDGLVAHLYGLSEAEFAYILTTFPLVLEPVKVAAQNAYRDVERGLVK